MSVENVNEESTAYLTVTFLDKDDGEEAPSSATYRIDCLTNGQEVRDDTVLTPGTSIEITLTPDDNAIIDQENTTERRLVTVSAIYGGDDELHSEYEYNVKNLRKKT